MITNKTRNTPRRTAQGFQDEIYIVHCHLDIVERGRQFARDGGRRPDSSHTPYKRHALALRRDQPKLGNVSEDVDDVLRRFRAAEARRRGTETEDRRGRYEQSVSERRRHLPGHGILQSVQVANSLQTDWHAGN